MVNPISNKFEEFSEALDGLQNLKKVIIVSFTINLIVGVFLLTYLILVSQYFLFLIELIVIFIPTFLALLFIYINIPKKIGILNDNLYFEYPKKIDIISFNDINTITIESKKGTNLLVLKIKADKTFKLALNDSNTKKLINKVKTLNKSLNIERV